MINTVILTGRITADPELKTTNSGNHVTSFSVAVDRPMRNGDERVTDFINIVAWKQTAEFVTKYFSKGDAIGIEGALQSRTYTDREGYNRTVFEVVARNVHFIERKREAAPEKPKDSAPQLTRSDQRYEDVNTEPMDLSGDDLPF